MREVTRPDDTEEVTVWWATLFWQPMRARFYLHTPPHTASRSQSQPVTANAREMKKLRIWARREHRIWARREHGRNGCCKRRRFMQCGELWGDTHTELSGYRANGPSSPMYVWVATIYMRVDIRTLHDSYTTRITRIHGK